MLIAIENRTMKRPGGRVPLPRGMRCAFGVHALAGWLASDTLKGGHQTQRVASVGLFFVAALVLTVCTANYYRRSADKQVYRIIREKQEHALGHATTNFTVDTPFSKRDPDAVRAEEIIGERMMPGTLMLTVQDALQTAVSSNRTYQANKETLYLRALTLTGDRHEFAPIPFAGATAQLERNTDRRQSASVKSQVGVGQLLQTGTKLSVSLANDILHYYTGGGQGVATTTLAVDLVQPLLRDSRTSALVEALTQGERDVIYETRTFSRFQTTFAVDIVVNYFRLLQQKDSIRSQYTNYRNQSRSRERAEAWGKDRMSPKEVDQARQSELAAKNSYLNAIESYRDALDNFKIALGLPLGTKIQVDDQAIAELTSQGVPPLTYSETAGYGLAVTNRLDLLNVIDQFEDAKRKIHVAARDLKADLNIFAHGELGSKDYTRFNFNDYHAYAGVTLNLPLDRLQQRNIYRTSIINFEVSLRSLAIKLDGVYNEVRQSLRGLELARQSYDIQKTSVTLAEKRVEGADLLVQAGRAEIRDLLDAQRDLLNARLALTAALVDYLSQRLGLLLDLGILNVDEEKFWSKTQVLPPAPRGQEAPPPGTEEVTTPEQLFGKSK